MSGPTELIRQNCPLATTSNDGLMSKEQVAALEEAGGSDLGWFDVRELGATGDGTTNDAAAFLTAYTAAVAAGGGVIFVPAGNYRFASAETFTTAGTNDITVLMLGNGSSSRIIVDTVGATMLTVSSVDTFEFRALTFIGYDQMRASDADIVIAGVDIKHFIMKSCSWFGVSAVTQGIKTTHCGNHFSDVSVNGCGLVSADPGTGWMGFFTWQYGNVNGCVFTDFGNLGGVYYDKTATVGMAAWIRIMESYSPPGPTGGNEFAVLYSSFDEGGSLGIATSTTDGTHVLGPNAVRVEGCSFLIGVLTGIYVSFAKKVILQNNTFNCNALTRSGIYIESCGNVVSQNNRRVNGSCTYLVDAGVTGTQSYEIIDCEYDTFYPPAVMPPVWVTTAGVRSRMRVSGAAVSVSYLVKPNGAGKYIKLADADDGSLATGVASVAATGADGIFTVVEGRGQVTTFKTDGTAISEGAPIYASAVAAHGGEVSAVSVGRQIGIATAAAGGGFVTGILL